MTRPTFWPGTRMPTSTMAVLTVMVAITCVCIHDVHGTMQVDAISPQAMDAEATGAASKLTVTLTGVNETCVLDAANTQLVLMNNKSTGLQHAAWTLVAAWNGTAAGERMVAFHATSAPDLYTEQAQAQSDSIWHVQVTACGVQAQKQTALVLVEGVAYLYQSTFDVVNGDAALWSTAIPSSQYSSGCGGTAENSAGKLLFYGSFRAVVSHVHPVRGKSTLSFWARAPLGQGECETADQLEDLTVNIAVNSPSYDSLATALVIQTVYARDWAKYTVTVTHGAFRMQFLQPYYSGPTYDTWLLDQVRVHGVHVYGQATLTPSRWYLGAGEMHEEPVLRLPTRFRVRGALPPAQQAMIHLRVRMQSTTSGRTLDVDGSLDSSLEASTWAVRLNATQLEAALANVEGDRLDKVAVSVNGGVHWSQTVPGVEFVATPRAYAVVNISHNEVLWQEGATVTLQMNASVWTTHETRVEVLGTELTGNASTVGSSDVSFALPPSPNQQLAGACRVCLDAAPVNVTNCSYLGAGAVRANATSDVEVEVWKALLAQAGAAGRCTHLYMANGTVWGNATAHTGPESRVCAMCMWTRPTNQHAIEPLRVRVTSESPWTPVVWLRAIDPVVLRLEDTEGVLMPLRAGEQTLLHFHVAFAATVVYGVDISVEGATQNDVRLYLATGTHAVPTQVSHAASGSTRIRLDGPQPAGDYQVLMVGNAQLAHNHTVVRVRVQAIGAAQGLTAQVANVSTAYPRALANGYRTRVSLRGIHFHAPMYLRMSIPPILLDVRVDNSTHAEVDVDLRAESRHLVVTSEQVPVLVYNHTQAGVFAETPLPHLPMQAYSLLERDSEIVLTADFDSNDISAYEALWASPSQVISVSRSDCGAVSGSRSLKMTGSGARSHRTRVLSLPKRTVTLSFWFIPGGFGNCELPDIQEDLYLHVYEYVQNSEGVMTQGSLLDQKLLTRQPVTWRQITHTYTNVDHVLFEWTQPRHSSSSFDAWGVDDVRVTIPTVSTQHAFARTSDTFVSTQQRNVLFSMSAQGVDSPLYDVRVLWSETEEPTAMHNADATYTTYAGAVHTPPQQVGLHTANVSVNGGQVYAPTQSLVMQTYNVSNVAGATDPALVEWTECGTRVVRVSGAGFVDGRTSVGGGGKGKAVVDRVANVTLDVTSSAEVRFVAPAQSVLQASGAFGCPTPHMNLDEACYVRVAAGGSCEGTWGTPASVWDREDNAHVATVAAQAPQGRLRVGLVSEGAGVWRWQDSGWLLGANGTFAGNWTDADMASSAAAGAVAEVDTQGTWHVGNGSAETLCVNTRAYDARVLTLQLSLNGQHVERGWTTDYAVRMGPLMRVATAVPYTLRFPVQPLLHNATAVQRKLNLWFLYNSMGVRGPVLLRTRLCDVVEVRDRHGAQLPLVRVDTRTWALREVDVDVQFAGALQWAAVLEAQVGTASFPRGYTMEQFGMDIAAYGGNASVHSVLPRVFARDPSRTVTLRVNTTTDASSGNGTAWLRTRVQGTSGHGSRLCVVPSGAGICEASMDTFADGTTYQVGVEVDAGMHVVWSDSVVYTLARGRDVYNASVRVHPDVLPFTVPSGRVNVTVAMHAPVFASAAAQAAASVQVRVDGRADWLSTVRGESLDTAAAQWTLSWHVGSTNLTGRTFALDVSVNGGETYVVSLAMAMVGVRVDTVTQVDVSRSTTLLVTGVGASQQMVVRGQSFSTASQYRLRSDADALDVCTSLVVTNSTQLVCTVDSTRVEALGVGQHSVTVLRDGRYEATERLRVHVLAGRRTPTQVTPNGRVFPQTTTTAVFASDVFGGSTLSPALRVRVDGIAGADTGNVSVSTDGTRVELMLADLWQLVYKGPVGASRVSNLVVYVASQPAQELLHVGLTVQSVGPTSLQLPVNASVTQMLSTGAATPLLVDFSSMGGLNTAETRVLARVEGWPWRACVPISGGHGCNVQFEAGVRGWQRVEISVTGGLSVDMRTESVLFVSGQSVAGMAVATNGPAAVFDDRAVTLVGLPASLSLLTAVHLVEAGSLGAVSVPCGTGGSADSRVCGLAWPISQAHGWKELRLALGNHTYSIETVRVYVMPYTEYAGNRRTLRASFDTLSDQDMGAGWLTVGTSAVAHCDLGVLGAQLSLFGSNRVVQTSALGPGTLSWRFDMRTPNVGSGPCERPDTNEDVYLEDRCTLDGSVGGGTWRIRQILTPAEYRTWKPVSYVRNVNVGETCAFRVRQAQFSTSAIDNWLLNDMELVLNNPFAVSPSTLDARASMPVTLVLTFPHVLVPDTEYPSGLLSLLVNGEENVAQYGHLRAGGVAGKVGFALARLPTQRGDGTALNVTVVLAGRAVGTFTVPVTHWEAPAGGDDDGGSSNVAGATDAGTDGAGSQGTGGASAATEAALWSAGVFLFALAVGVAVRVRRARAERDRDELLGSTLFHVAPQDGQDDHGEQVEMGAVSKEVDWGAYKHAEGIGGAEMEVSSVAPSYENVGSWGLVGNGWGMDRVVYGDGATGGVAGGGDGGGGAAGGGGGAGELWNGGVWGSVPASASPPPYDSEGGGGF